MGEEPGPRGLTGERYVEDRLTNGLYLELGSLDPQSYATQVAPSLASSEGVERVSWWQTLVPWRKELPMEVEDGTLLAVAEVDERFSPPAPSPGSCAHHHFRRYPRPGQGILSGNTTTGLLVVWISPRTPELTKKLRDWADFVHIRHIAAASLPGFTRITAYENAAGTDPLFMHFYELDTDDTETAYKDMARLVGKRLGGTRSEAFEHWADYEAAGGRLFYCNTFRLLGELRPSSPAAPTWQAGPG